MANTQNQDAAQFANDLGGFAYEINQLIVRAMALQARQVANNYLTTLAAMATYTPNADGSPPQASGVTTADGTPNQAHPIVGINVTENVCSSMYSSVVGDFLAFATGTAAPAQEDRRGTIGLFLP